jgi:ribosome maturation factor RimP
VSAARGSSRQDTTELAGRVEPAVAAAGFELEELVVTPAGRRSVVRVVVDRDEGVTLDDIAEVSRAVSAVLDEDDDAFGPAPYTLEVTSPGVDRPLTEQRHWRRNIGRLVTVAVGPTGATEQVTGRVTAVDDTGVTLAGEAPGKPGKKRPPTSTAVPWALLGSGRVQVEFGRHEDRDGTPGSGDHGADDGAADDGGGE